MFAATGTLLNVVKKAENDWKVRFESGRLGARWCCG